ncbi:MAG: hypothetical protein K2Q07_10820 [Burkholderiaceae bacterium]|nr:hypothetical protein [Burkholderiaceae bacterium]
MIRAYTAKYRLRNGARGTLPILARNSCAAVLAILETFGDQVRSVAVKPALVVEARHA